jgi:hypothetical protein
MRFLLVLSLLLVTKSVSADDWVPPTYWNCKVALYWSATWKNGKRSSGWNATPDVGGVPGKTDTDAQAFAHQVHQVHLQMYDLAGAKSRTYSNLVGKCWRDTKPNAPLGWPKDLAWQSN